MGLVPSEEAKCDGMRMTSLLAVLTLFSLTTIATAAPNTRNPFIAGNDVTWTTLGTNENSSMPLGNGDVALNVWTEQNGDILLLIAKSDAWSENGELLKLGRARVSLKPDPFVNSASFTQTLRLENGDVYPPVGLYRLKWGLARAGTNCMLAAKIHN